MQRHSKNDTCNKDADNPFGPWSDKMGRTAQHLSGQALGQGASALPSMLIVQAQRSRSELTHQLGALDITVCELLYSS